MTCSVPVFRFAPSPNGELHLGHALSALLNHQLAQQMGGRLLLRIEDIDSSRCSAASCQGIFDDLDWLGVSWQPEVRYQAAHLADYAQVLDHLQRQGLIYRCFASRSEIAAAARQWGFARDPDGAPVTPGVWRGASLERVEEALAAQKPFAWRLDMARALAHVADLIWHEWDEALFFATGAPRISYQRIRAAPQAWGDVVLARRDVPASYHLAAVMDDAVQHITHIVRGQDLFHATSVHRVLQALMGYNPPLYHHHRLILGGDGRKLSKSLRSTSLRALRAQGLSAQDIRQLVGL